MLTVFSGTLVYSRMLVCVQQRLRLRSLLKTPNGGGGGGDSDSSSSIRGDDELRRLRATLVQGAIVVASVAMRIVALAALQPVGVGLDLVGGAAAVLPLHAAANCVSLLNFVLQPLAFLVLLGRCTRKRPLASHRSPTTVGFLSMVAPPPPQS